MSEAKSQGEAPQSKEGREISRPSFDWGIISRPIRFSSDAKWKPLYTLFSGQWSVTDYPIPNTDHRIPNTDYRPPALRMREPVGDLRDIAEIAPATIDHQDARRRLVYFVANDIECQDRPLEEIECAEINIGGTVGPFYLPIVLSDG